MEGSMIAAKEARDLAENYAWSKLHFLNDTFDIIERFSKTGSLFVKISNHCKYHEGFSEDALDDLRVLGYKAEYDESEDMLIIEW